MNTKSLPILFTFRRCPYAMRARMAIQISGVAVEQVEVSLKNKPQSLLDYSSKGTVPVVVTSEGRVIDESRDIMLWALLQSDPENWLLQNDSAKQKQMDELIDTCDKEFKPLLDRYKYFDRHPEQSQSDYRQQAEVFIEKLENNLSNHNFLIDETLRFADVAIFPFIRQFAGVDADWFASSRYINVRRWLNSCINTALFEIIMKK
ncbi:MAG: glutathione S-transferase [Sphingobacteriales bacterium]|nr:MAG: glutathione S-transferase [Sphingobacteriales bacterium]